MGHITLKTHYDAPIEKVFKFGTDVTRMPEYMPWISDIRDIHGSLDQVESRFTFTDSVLGRKVEATNEVIAVEFPFLYETLTKYQNGTQIRWTDRLTKTTTGTDAETDIEYELSPGILNQVVDKIFLERMIERRVRHTYESYKALIEAERVPVVA